MPNYHFVPQFLLRRWANNGNMVSYRLDLRNEEVIEDETGVRRACAWRGLNDLIGVPLSQKRAFEDFLTDEIDTPAAVISKKILEANVGSLTQYERIKWAKFLVALPLRTLEYLRLLGPAEALKALRTVEQLDGASLEERAWANTVLRQNKRVYQRNWPIRIAMEFIEFAERFDKITEMRWHRRTLREGTLLLGDRPLLVSPKTTRLKLGIPLDNPRLRIALPLAPDVVFLAAFDDCVLEELGDMSDERLANRLNEETVACCANLVFALNSSLATFVRRRFSRVFSAPSA